MFKHKTIILMMKLVEGNKNGLLSNALNHDKNNLDEEDKYDVNSSKELLYGNSGLMDRIIKSYELSKKFRHKQL